MSETITKQEVVMIDYVFTKEETDHHSKQLAEEAEKKQRLEDEKKEVMSNFKAKIDAATSKINMLAAYINKGHDNRNMKVSVVRDFDAGIKRYYHLDDHRLLGEDKLTADDYQLQIPVEENA